MNDFYVLFRLNSQGKAYSVDLFWLCLLHSKGCKSTWQPQNVIISRKMLSVSIHIQYAQHITFLIYLLTKMTQTFLNSFCFFKHIFFNSRCINLHIWNKLIDFEYVCAMKCSHKSMLSLYCSFRAAVRDRHACIRFHAKNMDAPCTCIATKTNAYQINPYGFPCKLKK